MDRVARIAARLTGSPKAAVLRIGDSEDFSLAGVYRADDEPLPQTAFSPITERHRDFEAPLLEFAADDLVRDGEVTGHVALSHVFSTPEGNVGGTVVVFDREDREWADEDRSGLADVAEMAADALVLERQTADAEWFEDALQIQAAYLDHLFDEAPESIALLTSDRTVIRVNRAFTRLYGYSAEEAIGKRLLDLTIPPEAVEEAERLGERAQAGEHVNIQTTRLRKDGTKINVSLFCIPVHISREQVGLYVITSDVSDRIEVARAIQRNEQRYRALIENAIDLVAIVGTGGTVEYITPSVERVLGRGTESLIGSNGFGLIHPDDAPEVIARFTSVLRNSCDGMMSFRMRDGQDVWRTFEVRANNLMDDPEVAGVVVNARDITDERHAKQMQSQLNTFLEATPDFVATFDPHGRALTVNRAFRDLLEIEDGSTDDLTLTDLFPPNITERLLHEGIPTANRDGAWSGETMVQAMDGTEIPISQVVLAHRSISGKVEFISTLGRDITAQKEAEQALRRSEAHFRSLIENANDIISVTDVEGKLTFVSPSAKRVLGYETEEMIGQSIFNLVHEDEIAEVGETFTQIVHGANTRPPAEFRIRCKDGSYRRLETVSQNLLDNPAVNGVVINARDVTARRAAEEALMDSQQQLIQAQKMEAIGRLAGGIAHDFNNLLTAIKGFTELLLLDFEEADPRRGFASEIQGAASRAAGLTRQLLAFSRRQVLQPEVISLNEAVLEMEKMLERLIGEDLKMTTSLADGLGRVKADPGQIEQVVMNLVVNARDAMPNGGELKIRTANAELTEEDAEVYRYIEPGTYILLEVSDTGLGMPKEVQDRIFEPFFTTKEQGKGTGLGLSTVYGIIKQSGGYIWVDSDENVGTTFRIYLPRVEEEARRKTAGPDENRDLSGHEAILLVEDELAVRTLVKRVLERNGYRVASASDATQALALMEAGGFKPDLLLTDVIMPGMSGSELATELRARIPGLKVLYMSGYTDEAIVHHGVLDPGVSLLEKPFTPEILLGKLRDAIELSSEASS